MSKKAKTPRTTDANLTGVREKTATPKKVDKVPAGTPAMTKRGKAQPKATRTPVGPDDIAEQSVAISTAELAQLGGGIVAYIKVLTHDEARRMFPSLEDLPQGINLYALHAADGTPLALTDSRQAALGQAMGSELAVASLH